MEKQKLLIKNLQKEVALFKKLIHHDQMTGLYNRLGFAENVEKYLKELKGEHQKRNKNKRSFKIGNLSVVFIDLNDFKKFNDEYGHACGDEAIKAFAGFLKKEVRGTDVVSRWSGDEFVLTLVGTDKKGAQRTVEKIKRSIAGRSWNIFGRRNLNVSASFGIASVIDETRKPKQVFELKALIHEADKKMYEDKKRQKSLI